MGNNGHSSLTGDCDPVRGGTYYTYVCGPDRKWKKVPVRVANWACDLVNMIRGIAGSGGDSYDPHRNYDEDFTPKSQWVRYVDGPRAGTVTVRAAPGSPAPPRQSGDSPKKPSMLFPDIQFVQSGQGSCDPCPQRLFDAVADCIWGFLPMGCGLSVFTGGYDCINSCAGSDFGSSSCLSSCAGTIIGIMGNCTADLAGYWSGIGLGYNLVTCLYGLATACNTNDPAAYSVFAEELVMLSDIAVPQEMPSSAAALEQVLEQVERLEKILDALNYTLGDPIWFSGFESQEDRLNEWLDSYQAAIAPDGDGARWITDSQRQVLLTIPRPGQITDADIHAVCDRWNRTLDYWDLGKFNTFDLEPGDDPDFIAADVMLALMRDADEAVLKNEAEGHTTLFGGLQDAVELLKTTTEPETQGVCIEVKLQIQQSAVVARTGFTAQLQMLNISDVDALDNIQVDVAVTDMYGNDATERFGIYPPEVTGVSDVAGGGRLEPGKAFDAQWLLVPTLDAAPLEPTYYFVGGTIRYLINGGMVTIPIIPDTITVMPDAELHLKYFLERDVYGNDPFTDEIEPSIPFVLGLMVTNEGYGSAYNMTIHSAQPTIVRQEADKQILLDFELLDANVDDQPRNPSLEVALGHIAAGQTKTVTWRMQSSLQGQFIAYEADFAHTDTLGDPRLSLIQSISIHELVRAVRADRQGDDSIADFLTNDLPEADDLPDTLHLSDGTIEPVSAFLGSPTWLSGSPESGQVTVTLPHTPTGFFYVRLDNPGWPDYELLQVVRSDGKILPAENAWTTYKRHYPDGQDAYDEALLHLFDYQGTGRYTLYFAPPVNQPPTVSYIDIVDPTELSTEPLPLTITYQDTTGIDAATLSDDNIVVTDPYGEPLGVRYVDVLDAGQQHVTVRYEILPPNGLWEGSLNGPYTISLDDDQVADIEGLFAEGAVLGGFLVSIDACVRFEFDQAVLVGQRRISRTVYEMDYRLVVQNDCDTPIRNLRLKPESVPANFIILACDVRFCYIPAGGQAVSEGLLTVEFDYDHPPDLHGTFTWKPVLFHPADVTMTGTVDMADLAAFAAAWLTEDHCFDWAPAPHGNGRVDLEDFGILAEQWMSTEP